jgi:S1-C subfamily serine protease
MKPLYIYSNKLAAGSEVYAIGSPLKEELSGTVTKGIISGYREIVGLKWIQSDVPISPGNSGGPLVDSKGRIVGISTAGYQYGGSQVGINLFIPIEEALKYGYLKLSHR